MTPAEQAAFRRGYMAGQEKMREAWCKTVCSECEKGIPLSGQHNDIHRTAQGKLYVCRANYVRKGYKISALPLAEPEERG